MSNEINRIAEIKLNVSLNQENVPVALHWQSDDNPDTLNNTECKAFMLSIFDKTHRDTLKIDLWTDEMQIIEMDRFFYQTLGRVPLPYSQGVGLCVGSLRSVPSLHYGTAPTSRHYYPSRRGIILVCALREG
jgi:gliding motility-associated protein GldC